MANASVHGVIGMAGGHATMPAMGAAVTAGGAFRVVEFAVRQGWPGMDFLAADPAGAGIGATVMTLPDGATVQFREAGFLLS